MPFVRAINSETKECQSASTFVRRGVHTRRQQTPSHSDHLRRPRVYGERVNAITPTPAATTRLYSSSQCFSTPPWTSGNPLVPITPTGPGRRRGLGRICRSAVEKSALGIVRICDVLHSALE